MSFFELPRPTASAFRAVAVSPPAWLGPPHNVLPGIAPVELVLARTGETVVAIGGIEAYPEGFGFTLGLRLRTLSAREEQFPYLIDRAAYEADPLPDAFLRCQWPSRGIGESRVEIDAGVILQAAGRAVTLWPYERPGP